MGTLFSAYFTECDLMQRQSELNSLCFACFAVCASEKPSRIIKTVPEITVTVC